MVGPFEFATAQRIVFGQGKLSELSRAAKQFGDRALIVCGRNPERASTAVRLLGESGIECETFSIPGEPEVEVVVRGAEVARRNHCAVVIGFGGGSALDAAKAIAALAANRRDIFEYLEVVGRAQPFESVPLPVIAVPTTAGTGTEVTRNAVITSKTHRVKASLRSPAMLPRAAIVDPELTFDLPRSLTASTGMDALTQLIEPFVSHRANPFTDAFCRDGIGRAATALPAAFENGSDIGARTEMALASLYGGLALANAGLGAVHGFAAPIGGMFPAPHGAVCACLLPGVMRMNMAAARRDNAGSVLARYDEAARLLTNSPTAKGEDGARFVAELRERLSIPRLREFSIERANLPEIAVKAAHSSSMKANPIVLSQEELVGILEEGW